MPSSNTERQRTTSARRLQLLLRKLKSVNGINMYRAVPPALGIAATPEQIELGWPFAEAATLIGKMLSDFEVEISGTQMADEEKLFYLECKQAVTGSLAPTRVNQPWQQVRDAISEALITKLQGADMALRRYINEQMLAQADLRDSVEGALSVLKDSSLPRELQAFVSMHLIRVRTALDEYEYRGMAGLQDALAGYLGSLGAAGDQIRECTSEPQRRKLADVLNIANTVMNLAHSAAIAWPHLHAGFVLVAGLLST